MTDTAITTAIITISCVICVTTLVSAVYPSVNRAASSVISTSEKLGERIETSIDIVAEANVSVYEYVWAKNTGSSEIIAIDDSDVFFGPVGNFQRIPYNSKRAVAPSWNYTIENDDGDGRWDVGETLNITIDNSTEIPIGDYYVKISLFNGISDEEEFSI